MAVVRKCDRCGKVVDVSSENRQYVYEEEGKNYTVNSFRIGEWDAKNKQWNSIVSAYDLCYDCGKEITEAIFNVQHGNGDCDLTTRVPKIVKKGGADVANTGV
jgi:hypothetical protein